MSWDVVIVNSKGAPADLQSLPDDFNSEPLGAAASVRELISAVLPDVDWSDPSWGMFEGEGFSIEFNIGEEDPVEDAMLHVRGGGDPLPSIVRVCKRGGWLAFDTSEDAAIDLDNPSRAGWEAFVAFRDQVIGKVQSEATGQSSVPANGVAVAANAEASLPGSDLLLEDGKLLSTDGKNVVSSHALSEMKNLRFGTGTRLFAVVAAVLCSLFAVASKLWIGTAWLNWILTVVLGLLAIKFLLAVRGEMVWFLEGGQEKSYPLLGSSEEIDAFRSALKHACQEARRKR